MIEFYKTPGGREFVDRTVKKIASNLETLSKEQKRANDLKEFELAQKMSIYTAIQYFPNNELVRKQYERKVEEDKLVEQDEHGAGSYIVVE